jgi:hypothetical protein
MQAPSQERWRSFLVWLGTGVSGIPPFTLRLTLGPVAALLPLVRQIAREVGPWLLALLQERQRLGLALAAGDASTAAMLECDSAQQLYRCGEARRNPRWLGWLLGAELARLARLAEAPESALLRLDWLTWEVRYWALAVCLARLGQLYAELARRQGHEAATQALEEALARAWHEATRECEPDHSIQRFVEVG